MQEQEIEIITPEGRCDAFHCYPDGGGPYPGIIFLMDALGLRDELRDMARRLATSDYNVLLPNLYYREIHGDPKLDPEKIEIKGPERSRMWRLVHGIDIDKVTKDCGVFLDFLSACDNVKKGPKGIVGYCMSGRYAIGAAAAYPESIGALASFYGAALVTDGPESPHLRMNAVKADCYFAFAEHDSYVPEQEVRKFSQLAASSGANVRIETYPGSSHGFAFPARQTYDRVSSELHWERLIELYRRNL